MNSHKNVLKLLGCCLETEIPMLVFEFAVGGCLSDHIYENPILSWESRLRIATEIADAVAYLHYGTSKPIIHRDIKSTNIFLDQHYVAKLFKFRLSISIPLGQTHVDGNLSSWYIGSIAPESNGTWRFTEKSDVYSFGLVLSFILADDNEEDIRVYLRANIVKGNTQQLMACAQLAIRCVKVNPEERPSMIEAANELRRISRLRIATEIADAVAYLHNGTSKPIIHRDIKSTNIFLDDHYVAKLFDFELSILIPLGQTQVEADVAGTHAFIAPEILHTSRYTEKSDVYSFGMVLFEILTRKRASDLLKKFYNVQALDKIEKNKRLYLEATL
ncbi:hypothetical protein HHK36_022263 [Tetracentron sinense]|uniref:Protein kinase domain-containing protein n=1 Tax=Tetracentron sinense TaxID=13715 RepID=A0A835D5Y1_TETSI|nr:hypothetical protein HHK36_022263 [Tetracentron sinense]